VGVGAVVLLDGSVVLIRRGKPPLQGRWTIPGGTVEPGESLEQAIVREVLEETGLAVRPREPLAILDQIGTGAGRTLRHYVIVDFLCDWVSGTARAGSDARDLALVPRGRLRSYRLTPEAHTVVLEGLRRRRAQKGLRSRRRHGKMLK
jgi:ADP-ribose pyrophosphatase YjhB (NUDIX family)